MNFLIRFLRESINRNEEDDYIDELSDYELERELEIKKRNLALLEKIVGESLMDQIDYIIDNGFDKYNYWYRCYETGSIYSPATVEQAPIKEEGVTVFVYGGKGNKRIASY